MKKHFFFALCSLFLLTRTLFCGFERMPSSARISAMGMASAASQNQPALIFSNMAGLANISATKVSFNYSRPYGMKELDIAFAAGILPVKFGTLAIGISNYGFELYREQSIVLGFSRTLFKNFSVGASFHYQKLEIKNYGQDFSLTFDLGFLLALTDQVNWGFYTTNLTRSRFQNNRERLPQNFSTGISYQPLENFVINIDIFKEITFPLEVRSGFEYGFWDKVMIRCGVISDPAHYCFGVGFRFRQFVCDYGVSFHPQLGATHQFSLSFEISSGNKRR